MTPESTARRIPFADRLEAARERAAVMEFDGGLSRDEAERQAAKAWDVPVEVLREDVGGAR